MLEERRKIEEGNRRGGRKETTLRSKEVKTREAYEESKALKTQKRKTSMKNEKMI